VGQKIFFARFAREFTILYPPLWNSWRRPCTILINQQAVVSRTFTIKLRLNIFGSHAASFKRPLLSVDQSMCVRYSVRLFVCNFNAKIAKTIRSRGSCPIRSLRKSAHGASIGDINDEVTWLYDVMLVTSQNSKSSRSQTSIGELTETPAAITHAQKPRPEATYIGRSAKSTILAFRLTINLEGRSTHLLAWK